MRIENAVVTGANLGIGRAISRPTSSACCASPGPSRRSWRPSVSAWVNGGELADELTLQVNRGLTAARPAYLPQAS